MLYDGKAIEVQLPSNTNGKQGKLVTVFPVEGVALNLIDIKSATIPEYIEEPIKNPKELKINYCSRGRCELKLQNGEFTYLTCGEISIDAGQALNSFYYPSEEYEGFEVVISMNRQRRTKIAPIHSDKAAFSPASEFVPEGYTTNEECDTLLTLGGERFLLPKKMYDQCAVYERPWIKNADKFLNGIYEDFKYFVNNRMCIELILVKIIELILYINQLDFSQSELRRTYYTFSQIEIAKRTHDIILSDLSVRHTAKNLAEKFGISETSLKNYFRSVYGCGYSEYQQTVRMQKAAELLKNSNEKVSAIAAQVGFATQTKFGIAFKECYGLTPLEYRRKENLNSDNYEEG